MAINYGLLDTTIPAQIGAVPANALAMAFKARQQGTENALADMQLKKAQQDMADEAAFRTALGGVQGGDYGAAMPALVQASPTRAIALQKTLDEGQKNKLDVTLRRFDAVDRVASQFAGRPTRQMGVWAISQLAALGYPKEVIDEASAKLNAAQTDEDVKTLADGFLRGTRKAAEAHVASLYPKPAQPSDLARLMAERDRAAAAGDAAGVAAYDAEISKTRVAQTETERHHRALEAKPAGGGPVGGSGGTTALADAIVEGTQPPDTAGLPRSTAAAVRVELAKRGFNLARAQNDWSATRRHINTLNGPQQVRLAQAASTAMESLNNIEELYNEWEQIGGAGQFPVLNKGALATAKQLPGRKGEVAQALETNIADLTSELGSVYMGGNATTNEALKLAATSIIAGSNPGQFKESVKQARRNIGFRLHAVQSVGVAGASESNPYAAKTGGEAPGAAAAKTATHRFNPATGKIEAIP